VSPGFVLGAGATDLRNGLTAAQLTQVLVVFMASLKDAFVVPIALAGTAFFVALLLDRNMRKKGAIKLAAA
jgi:hypothetical protein